jgi:hypothetical protein
VGANAKKAAYYEHSVNYERSEALEQHLFTIACSCCPCFIMCSPHGSKCWLYFPEDDCPYYRATVFSYYADANCPAPDVQLPTLCLADGSNAAAANGSSSSGPYWSLMFEVSESSFKPVAQQPVQLAGTAGTWWVDL